MSVPATPSERQLRYLRTLAARTATTFAQPLTRREASREIDRLIALSRSAAHQLFDAGCGDEEEVEYATAVRADEITGFGSGARWRSRPHLQRAPTGGGDLVPSRAVRLRAYRVSGGERVLIAERNGDEICIRDIPAHGEGPSYPVEQLRAEEGAPALSALLADYLGRASELDEIPMAQAALAQMLGPGGAR